MPPRVANFTYYSGNESPATLCVVCRERSGWLKHKLVAGVPVPSGPPQLVPIPDWQSHIKNERPSPPPLSLRSGWTGPRHMPGEDRLNAQHRPPCCDALPPWLPPSTHTAGQTPPRPPRPVAKPTHCASRHLHSQELLAISHDASRVTSISQVQSGAPQVQTSRQQPGACCLSSRYKPVGSSQEPAALAEAALLTYLLLLT